MEKIPAQNQVPSLARQNELLQMGFEVRTIFLQALSASQVHSKLITTPKNEVIAVPFYFCTYHDQSCSALFVTLEYAWIFLDSFEKSFLLTNTTVIEVFNQPKGEA
jgi:hypothetical protein